jgi:hypothetical protein
MLRLAASEPVDLGPGVVAKALHDARAERDDQIAAALAGRDTEVDDAGRG